MYTYLDHVQSKSILTKPLHYKTNTFKQFELNSSQKNEYQSFYCIQLNAARQGKISYINLVTLTILDRGSALFELIVNF